jgi:hypothetical protein
LSVVRSFGTVQAVFGERLWLRHGHPTGHRPFPFKGISQAQAAAMRKEVSIEEYRRRIAKRMQSLECSEPPPRVMLHVLTEWGIQSVTASSV